MNNRDTKLIDASEQTVRAAWLYHVAGNTQEQTADLLGTSRVKVNRLLAEARESGIVKISIEHRFARMAGVEEAIRNRHNLLFCRTTPPLMSYSTTRRKKRSFARETRSRRPDRTSRGGHCRGGSVARTSSRRRE